jgi:hypothetical protein
MNGLGTLKLVALLALTSTVVLAQAQKTGHLTDGEAGKTQQGKQSAPPPPIISKSVYNFISGPTPRNAGADGQKSANDGVTYQVAISDKPFHFWLPFVINLLVASVGVVTAAAVMFQVTGLIRSQRAWVLVAPDKFDPQKPLYGPEMKNDLKKFPIQIRNVGLSPARIDAVAFRYCVLDSLSSLSADPVYPQAVPYNGWVVAPQESVGHMVPLEGAEDIPVLEYDQHILKGTKVLFAYGCVKYRDIFNRKRETRISYAYEYHWMHMAMAPTRRIKQAGPEAYNKST